MGKIRAKLPNYDPDSGQKLDWSISFYKTGTGYDPKTGELLDSCYYPKISIKQRPPNGYMTARTCFGFNWSKKELKKLPASWV